MTKKLCLGMVVVLALSMSFAQAGTIVLQQGLNSYSGASGGDLKENGPTTNNGNLKYLAPMNDLGLYGTMETSLIRFDLAGMVPAGATITSATLTLYEYTDRKGGRKVIHANRVKTEWQAGTGGFTGASWLYSWQDGGSNRVAWTDVTDGADGALGSGNIETTPTATADWTTSTKTTSWPAFDPPTQVDWDVTSDVVAFIDGTYTNYGWLLSEDSAYYGKQPFFYSSAYADDTSYRPMLTIEYTPEPTTMALLGTSALFLLRRRKNR